MRTAIDKRPGCEWNPRTNQPAHSQDAHHRRSRAAFRVGLTVEWRICGRCAKLPKFRCYPKRIIPMTRRNQCLMCPSVKCYTRIYSLDGEYDEIACAKHVRALEKDYDSKMKGTPMNHVTSSAGVRRRDPKTEPVADGQTP